VNMMQKRQRIGTRYISRRKDGTFSKNVDVGRSLSADRRTKAKRTVKAGYGDKGDVKSAESFNALDMELDRNDCCELWVEKMYDNGRIGFGEASNLLASIEMDGLKCSSLGSSNCSKENMGAESFGADYTTVQRPHHVARVRNDRIGGGKHGLKQWNEPNMHTDQNKLGKMYDEEKGGWVQMDDEARSMFENAAEEFGADVVQDVKDFDVVGTAQDVVGKTGLKIPTGVASLAVVWVAYMTGKRYGN